MFLDLHLGMSKEVFKKCLSESVIPTYSKYFMILLSYLSTAQPQTYRFCAQHSSTIRYQPGRHLLILNGRGDN